MRPYIGRDHACSMRSLANWRYPCIFHYTRLIIAIFRNTKSSNHTALYSLMILCWHHTLLIGLPNQTIAARRRIIFNLQGLAYIMLRDKALIRIMPKQAGGLKRPKRSPLP